MNTRILSVLAATASIVAIITDTCLRWRRSSAQEVGARGETGLEEVVVTARRREEKAQSRADHAADLQPGNIGETGYSRSADA